MVKDEYAHDLDEKVRHSLGREALRTIIDWVARFSYWVSPDIYREIQVGFPSTRRKHASGERRGEMIQDIRVWENQPARDAFWRAFGDSPNRYRNYVVCHIYEGSPYLPEHFTNLANLTILPKCLDSFSEWEPVRAVLKWHSYAIYGYRGPAAVQPARPHYYPAHWPGISVLGPGDTSHVVSELKERRQRRPSFYSKTVALEANTS